MNNYKQIIGDTNFPTTDAGFEYYKRPVDITASPPTAYNTLKTNLPSVRIHDFNYDTSTPATKTQIGNKEIRLNKSNGELHVNIGASPAQNWTIIKNFPLLCDKMYPMLIASKDNDLHKKHSKFDNNVYRCAYSQLCGIPCSNMNCDSYADITY